MVFDFTERSSEWVTVKNHSTSNTAEIEFRSMHEEEQGGPLKLQKNTIWIDHDQLEDLIYVMTLIKNCSDK